jgi:hypothetical protein
MSLNAEQMHRTSQELLANRKRCPLDDQTLSQVLGFTPQRLENTLEINAVSKPGDVWLLCDFLEQAITDFGGTPLPFTVLTSQSRAQSEVWFGVRRVPVTPTQM